MDARETGFLNRMPVMLGAALLAGGLAGFGVLNQYGEAVLDQSIAATPLAQAVCRYCGVVEGVREIKASRADYRVSTISASRDEAIVMLLSALSGAKVSSAQPRIYEVSVRMDDGSIRAVRANYAPKWRPGDRVKIIKNRVRSLS
jgi:hypothetical protein